MAVRQVVLSANSQEAQRFAHRQRDQSSSPRGARRHHSPTHDPRNAQEKDLPNDDEEKMRAPQFGPGGRGDRPEKAPSKPANQSRGNDNWGARQDWELRRIRAKLSLWTI